MALYVRLTRSSQSSQRKNWDERITLPIVL